MKQRSEQGRAHHVDPPKASRVGSITVLSGTLSLTKIYLTETRRCPNGGATLSQPGRAIPAGLRADLRGHPRGNMVKRLFPGADRRAPTFLCMWVRGRADACTQPLTSARTRGQTTWLQVETASNAHAARSSGRRLRPPARTHCETAGTAANRSVA